MNKKFITALIASSLAVSCIGVGVGAFAGSNQESIKAYLNLGIKFTVDGKGWSPTDSTGTKSYPITYNATPDSSIGFSRKNPAPLQVAVNSS